MRLKVQPFDPLAPNATTIAAMEEALAGGLPRFENVQSLLDDLHADDSSERIGSSGAPTTATRTVPKEL